LGDDPADRVPIKNVLGAVEAILRHPRRLMFQLRQPGAGQLIGAMLLASLVCSLVYGLIIGSFSGAEQWWAAPVKFTGGLFLSALICLPSLYIFAGLSGSTARAGEIFGLVVGLLLLMTILLIGFAPVAWLFSQSTNSILWMGFLHLMFWFMATAFGLRFLDAGFRQSNARSSAGLKTWTVIFMLVALQMSTALRPLLGRADTFLPTEKQFFLTHWGDCMKLPDNAPQSKAKD
jgi:Kef-type K+ transport system membrane component KefB